MLQEFYITAFDRQKNRRRDGPTITNRDYIILFKAVTVVVFFFFRLSASGEERTESGHKKKTGKSLQHAINVALRRLCTMYLEVCQKYSAARRIFNSLLGVSSGDETLRLMFDILLLKH